MREFSGTALQVARGTWTQVVGKRAVAEQVRPVVRPPTLVLTAVVTAGRVAQWQGPIRVQ